MDYREVGESKMGSGYRVVRSCSQRVVMASGGAGGGWKQVHRTGWLRAQLAL